MNGQYLEDILAVLSLNLSYQENIIKEINQISEIIKNKKQQNVLNKKQPLSLKNYFYYSYKIFPNKDEIYFQNHDALKKYHKWSRREDKVLFDYGHNLMKHKFSRWPRRKKYDMDISDFNPLPSKLKEPVVKNPIYRAWPCFSPGEFQKLIHSKKLKRMQFECLQRWINYLHPKISKKEWSIEEDLEIIKYAKIFGCRNWHLIAHELNSSRRPWQCLSRFQQSLNKEMWLINWTLEEDDGLRRVVSQVGTKDWHTVASKLYFKTNEQCRYRYFYLLNKENNTVYNSMFDEKLLFFASKYQHKWSLVSRKMKINKYNCRERYLYLAENRKQGKWSINEDIQLINATQNTIQSRGKWAHISKSILGRTIHSVVRRFSILFEKEHFLRLFKEVWCKKNLVSNHNYNKRPKSSINYEDTYLQPILPKKITRKTTLDLVTKNNEENIIDLLKVKHVGSNDLNGFYNSFNIWMDIFSTLVNLSTFIIEHPNLPNSTYWLEVVNNNIASWQNASPYKYINLNEWENSFKTQMEEIIKLKDQIMNILP